MTSVTVLDVLTQNQTTEIFKKDIDYVISFFKEKLQGRFFDNKLYTKFNDRKVVVSFSSN